jgi:hypothetical protein
MKIRDMKIVREILMTRDVRPEACPAEEFNALGNDVANAPIHTGRATRLRPVLGCLILCLLPLIVMPQQAAKQETKQVDEEEQMDSALRKFGYISGQACQCQKQGGERTKFERRTLDIATGILRLFGSDRAFYYAAAFGAGVSEEMDQKKCPEIIKQYETMLGKVKVFAAK